MAEITRLSGCSDWLELDFVERERTLSELMKLGIRLHLVGQRERPHSSHYDVNEPAVHFPTSAYDNSLVGSRSRSLLS